MKFGDWCATIASMKAQQRYYGGKSGMPESGELSTDDVHSELWYLRCRELCVAAALVGDTQTPVIYHIQPSLWCGKRLPEDVVRRLKRRGVSVVYTAVDCTGSHAPSGVYPILRVGD